MASSLLKTPSQADKRRSVTAHDQHGRRWEAVIEITTGEPCSTWMPLFSAPWFPPPQSVKRDPLNNARIVIDYAEILKRGRQDLQEYRAELRAHATRMPGVVDVEATVENPPAALLDLVGTGPEPVQFAYAASIGNPWALGFDPEVPEWAAALLPASEDSLAAAFPDIEGSERKSVPQRAAKPLEQLSAEEEAELAEMAGAAGIEGAPKRTTPARGPGGKFLPANA